MTDAVLIAGPTASGKSAAAMALAERIGGVIVNTDSMQVYRELRVLTARPSPEDEARVPHLNYGHVPVAERYSAGRFEDDALRALAEAKRIGRTPVFVGGTGLYFEVLERGIAPIPEIPTDVQAANRARLKEIGKLAFYAEFATKDPETASRLGARDSQRVLRAADVLAATGRPLLHWQEREGRAALRAYKQLRFVIAPEREELYRRTDDRFDQMMKLGALEEAATLKDLDSTLPAARALGVQQFLRHLAGEISLEDAVEDAKRETRRYAKRQLTWFRNRMDDWRWIEDGSELNTLL